MNVKKFLVFLLLIGCGTVNNEGQETLEYSLIDKLDYKGIYNQTKQFSNIASKNQFNMDYINGYNRSKSEILERENFIDFDTIFSSAQVNAIDEKIKNLKEINLKKKKLSNSTLTKSNPYVYITYPIIQKGRSGNIYGIIYESTSTESLIRIFKQVNGEWVQIVFSPLTIS